MEEFIFVIMVAIAVCLLALGLFVPVFGEGKQVRRRLNRQLQKVAAESGEGHNISLVRERYLKKLSPLERGLESLPGMERLSRLMLNAGASGAAYRYVLFAVGLAVLVAGVAWAFLSNPLLALLAGAMGFAAPFGKLLSDRAKRMARLEEQLPEALDIMKRALQAGHPFSETLQLVAKEMKDPISSEFEYTFNDLNYGGDLRVAMLGLLERVPSVTMMALVTSILVQKETGGNLAEILEKISQVIRGRFRFHRRLKTLSAEGRLSAWILVLIPFVLFLVLSVIRPDYLPVLTENETGRTIIAWAFGLTILGILWIKRIIRIRV